MKDGVLLADHPTDVIPAAWVCGNEGAFPYLPWSGFIEPYLCEIGGNPYNICSEPGLKGQLFYALKTSAEPSST